MADLNEIQSAGTTKIVGSDSSGLETNPVNADANGNLQVTNYANGPVTPGTVAAKSGLVGGQYNSSLPTLTNGQQAALQTDSAARLLIGSIFSPLPAGSNTIGAVSQAGTWTTARSWTLASGTDYVSAVQSGTWNINNISGTVSLPTGAATEATLSSINTKTPTVGQKTMAGSSPVVIASDQSAIQVVGNIASGSADSGNPLKIGGVYNTVLPVVSSGQRVDLQLDQNGRLLTSTAVTSSLPAASFSNQRVITNGTTVYTSFTASVKLAIKQFYAGGTGVGRQVLYSYAPTNTLFLNAGDFETTGDVASWPYFTSGGSGTGTVALSTVQAFTGTHSAAVTFTTSDANHSNGLKQIFGTAIDISGWRYITAEFFNTVSAGAAYTRTISIVVTDTSGNTRKFDVSGLSTASPFNASNWIKITGEIANPTSSTGTGFDVTSIASIELRMVDSASRAGTVYWDTARLEAQITTIFPIYHYQSTSLNIPLDPVFVMEIGDKILIAQTNNDTSKQEYYAFAGGVQI